jgi:hypothetical protein
MNPADNIKHQLYRHRDKEVILVRDTHWVTNPDNTRGKVLQWEVREVTLDRGQVKLGEPFDIPAGELSPIGRTILAPAA